MRVAFGWTGLACVLLLGCGNETPQPRVKRSPLAATSAKETPAPATEQPTTPAPASQPTAPSTSATPAPTPAPTPAAPAAVPAATTETVAKTATVAPTPAVATPAPVAPAAATSGAAPAAPAPAKIEGNWGAITGRVVWTGDMAEVNKALDVPASNQDAKHCLGGGPLPDEGLAVDPNTKGLRFCFAYLELAPGKTIAIHPSLPQNADEVAKADAAAFSEINKIEQKELQSAISAKKVDVKTLTAPAMIDQVYCRFIPYSLAVRKGQKVLAKNPEPVSHNLNITNVSNDTMPPGSASLVELQPQRSVVQVACNIHPWMKMWAMVFDHPYYAVTDESGTFTLNKVPAGDLEVTIRQPNGKYVARKVKVTIKPGQTVDMGTINWNGKK